MKLDLTFDTTRVAREWLDLKAAGFRCVTLPGAKHRIPLAAAYSRGGRAFSYNQAAEHRRATDRGG